MLAPCVEHMNTYLAEVCHTKSTEHIEQRDVYRVADKNTLLMTVDSVVADGPNLQCLSFRG